MPTPPPTPSPPLTSPAPTLPPDPLSVFEFTALGSGLQVQAYTILDTWISWETSGAWPNLNQCLFCLHSFSQLCLTLYDQYVIKLPFQHWINFFQTSFRWEETNHLVYAIIIWILQYTMKLTSKLTVLYILNLISKTFNISFPLTYTLALYQILGSPETQKKHITLAPLYIFSD